MVALAKTLRKKKVAAAGSAADRRSASDGYLRVHALTRAATDWLKMP